MIRTDSILKLGREYLDGLRGTTMVGAEAEVTADIAKILDFGGGLMGGMVSASDRCLNLTSSARCVFSKVNVSDQWYCRVSVLRSPQALLERTVLLSVCESPDQLTGCVCMLHTQLNPEPG